MNMYHGMALITTLCNLVLGISFIFLIDMLRANELMLQYFILYLLTMAITVCLWKISNEYDFNSKYGGK